MIEMIDKLVIGLSDKLVAFLDSIRYFEFLGMVFDIYHPNDLYLLLSVAIIFLVASFVAYRKIKNIFNKYKKYSSIQDEHKKFLGSDKISKDKEQVFRNLQEIENKLLVKGEQVEVDAMTAMYMMTHHRNYGGVVSEDGRIVIDTKKEKGDDTILRGAIPLGGAKKTEMLFVKKTSENQEPLVALPEQLKRLPDGNFELTLEDGRKNLIVYEDDYAVIQPLPPEEDSKRSKNQSSYAEDAKKQEILELQEKVSKMEDKLVSESKKSSQIAPESTESDKNQKNIEEHNKGNKKPLKEVLEQVEDKSEVMSSDEMVQFESLAALLSEDSGSESDVVSKIRKQRKSTTPRGEELPKEIEENRAEIREGNQKNEAANESKEVIKQQKEEGTKISSKKEIVEKQAGEDFAHTALQFEWGKDELFVDSESWSKEEQLALVVDGILEMQQLLAKKGVHVFFSYHFGDAEVFYIETNFLAAAMMRAYAKSGWDEFRRAYISSQRGVKPEFIEVMNNLNKLSREESDNTFIKIFNEQYFYTPLMVYVDDDNVTCYRAVATRVFPDVLGDLADRLFSRFRGLPEMRQIGYGRDAAKTNCPNGANTTKVSIAQIEQLLKPALV